MNIQVTLEGDVANVLRAMNIPKALSVAFTAQLSIGQKVDWTVKQMGLTKFKAKEIE